MIIFIMGNNGNSSSNYIKKYFSDIKINEREMAYDKTS